MTDTEPQAASTPEATPGDARTPAEAELIRRIEDVNRRLAALSPDISAWIRVAGPHALRAIAQTVPPGKLFSIVLQLTPKHGDVFANHRKTNRRERPIAIRALRRDMENFAWELGGQGISFEAATGLLDNGNHRAMALQNAREGTVIHQLCVFGAEDSKAVDTGLVRTLGDELSRRGVPNGKAVAAIAVRMEAIDADPSYPVSPGKYRKASRQELFSYINSHPELADAVRRTRHVEALPEYVPSAAAGTILMLLRRAAAGLPTGNAAWADQFFDSWATMVSVESGNPIHELRKIVGRRRALRDADAKRDEKVKAPDVDEVIALAMVAWNKWQLSQHVTRLTLPYGSALSNQNFPWPAGYAEWKKADAGGRADAA